MTEDTRIQGTPTDPPRRPGDGNVAIAVGVVKGRVHVELEPGKDWFAMDPENARVIALAISKAAYEATYGVKPGGSEGAAGITDDIRMRCINRVSLVASGMGREGKTNQEIATAVVDALLPMIL